MGSFLPAHEAWSAPGAGRTAFLLHGIFGSARNWRSFGKRFAERCPEWRIVGVDLRNHGGSQGASPPHTLEACSGDLAALADRLGGPDALLGHSFGGKVALVHAARRPAGLRALWLLDSPLAPPGGASVPREDGEAGRALRAMREMPAPIRSRAEATGFLKRRGIAAPVAAWLATNLVPAEPDGFRWCFDLAALGEMLRDYWSVDGRALLAGQPAGLEVHAVRGGRSDRWSEADLAALADQERRGRLRVHVLPRAAHWLQADDPDGLLEAMAPWFGATPGR